MKILEYHLETGLRWSCIFADPAILEKHGLEEENVTSVQT